MIPVSGPAEVFHQFPVDRFGIKPLTVVIATGPFHGTLVLFMARVLQGVAKFKITENATHIFRWAGSFAFKAGQLRSQFRIKIAAFLENKLMLPAVPEIIQITEGTAFLFDQISKTVSAADQPVFFRFRIFRVAFIPDGKFVQMAVGPAYDNLDNILPPVQLMLAGTTK